MVSGCFVTEKLLQRPFTVVSRNEFANRKTPGKKTKEASHNYGVGLISCFAAAKKALISQRIVLDTMTKTVCNLLLNFNVV